VSKSSPSLLSQPRLIILIILPGKAFDTETFKRYVAEWVVVCDQPFKEVERLKFHRLLEYMHMGSKPLDIPHRGALKNCIMMMGKDTVEGIQNMVKVQISSP